METGGCFVDMGHGEDAGAHFGGHAEAGEIGGPEGVAGEPFIGDGYGALVFVSASGDAEAGEEGAGEFGQEVEAEADRAADEADECG
jgi:hypothetical protein